MYLLMALFFAVLIYFYIENAVNRRCLKSFRAVIHVNGIRGKTSTCRYLDAALRTKYKVFTKTTGTDAMIIGTDGRETPVRRLGPANIHEQLRMIRRARREGAEILILECMAVNPELQKIAQEQIVRSGITVITNARYDHVFEMGDTPEDIARSLSATIPSHGALYTADKRAAGIFGPICRERDCVMTLVPPTGTAAESVELARAVSKRLGVPDDAFESSLSRVKTDFGAQKIYPMKNGFGKTFHFLSLFSANDPVSTKNNIEAVRGQYGKLYFLYNHREDRPDRALLFARHFFRFYEGATVYISGRGAALPMRLFKGTGPARLLRAPGLDFLKDIPEGALLVGIGNIKGLGYELVKELEAGGKTP